MSRLPAAELGGRRVALTNTSATSHVLTDIILDEHGTTRPLREAIAELVHDLTPLAERLGCSAELDDVLVILEAGASYERQRKVAADNGGDASAVVDSLLAEMRAGHPGLRP